MIDLIYKQEAFDIIGSCMEVHNHLGGGFLEIVYKDALELELDLNRIDFEREEEYAVHYKGNILKHKFYADFVVMDKIILEIKAVKELTDEHRAQAINYLTVSECKLALLVNFGRGKLEYERFVL